MNEPFLLPVSYNNTSLELPARLVMLGYTYQFHIEVEGKMLVFEKDEERNYRVIDNTPDIKPPGKLLVEAIIRSLIALQD